MSHTPGTIVLDLDGTICFDGHSIDPVIVDALLSARDEGMRIVFASARPIRDQLPLLHPELSSHAQIGGNGALVRAAKTPGAAPRDGVRTLAAFTAGERIELERLLAAHEACVLADGSWDYSYDGPADHVVLARVDSDGTAKRVARAKLDPLVKLLVVSGIDLPGLALRLLERGFGVHVHAREGILDISPPGVDKASALDALGIEEYVALGNDSNDVALLAGATRAVRVGDDAQLDAVATESVAADPEAVAGKIRQILADR